MNPAWLNRRLLTLGGAALSGVLLALAFAPFELADASWGALIPLLIACAAANPHDGWRLGWVAGGTFWLITMFWLTQVTAVGWFLLSLYCGAYLIPIGMVATWWFNRFGVERFLGNAGFMLVITAVWISFEYLRSVLFTGFPWNPLGAAQFANVAFIQHAAWGGVYAVSALLVWVNAALALTILRYVRGHARLGRKPHPELMMGMALVVTAFVLGGRAVRQADLSGEEIRVALIQPAIPQDNKWDAAKVEMIYDRLRELTTGAVVWTEPDLVVWPETALPFDLRLSASCYELTVEMARLGVPLLVGTMDQERVEGRAKPLYFNSSFLFDPSGRLIMHYEKRHLVLFGEYVPFHDHITFITAKTPLQESFTAGTTSTVFRLPGRNISFSALICFEDTLAYLAREAVRNGARLLVNQTNDAWFDPYWASRQHMILSIFRAVENRVPLVRSANTGYSCAIDSLGRVREVLAGENGRHDGPGFQLATVRVPPEAMPMTFYNRNGDWFALACLPVGLVALGAAWRRRPAGG